jgi:hypothetical protein
MFLSDFEDSKDCREGTAVGSEFLGSRVLCR